jgi:paraquat-inducible protein B
LITALRAAASQIQATASAAKTAIGGPEQQQGIDQAMGELTRAARSVRVLADYLERHPESLLRGKRR